MPMPTIYFIRHGETSWNAEGRLQGVQDIALNDLGRRQAAHAGRVLAGLLADNRHDKARLAFVASPLIRARATMELVRSELGLPPGDYALDRRLREIGYGTWEGSTLAQAHAADPALYARRQADKWTVSAPDGESYVEVQARMTEWYHSVTSNTVAVAHGGTARALMVALGHETPATAADLFIEQGAVYVFGEGTLKKYG